MKCSLGISNFLEEISSLSHSIVFLYFFAVITEEGFCLSPCYSLELCSQVGISFVSYFAFHFPFFSAICKPSSDHHFAFFISFSWRLEKDMATHYSFLAWKIPWMEEPGGLQSQGLKELDTTERLHFFFLFLGMVLITASYSM